MPQSLNRRLPRLLVALAVVAALAVLFVYGPGEAEILDQRASWQAAVADSLLLAILIFFAAEVLLVGLSTPVATGLSILAGMLFGRWYGTLVVSFASTLGALVAMLIARYVLSDSLRRRAATRPRLHRALHAVDAGIERDGWFYLLLIRLTPVLPFFVVNLCMGLTRIRLWTYWWATQLGMLPTTFLVVSAGAEAGQIKSFRELASFQRLWPLLLLAAIPLALRPIVGRYLRRRPEEDPRSPIVT